MDRRLAVLVLKKELDAYRLYKLKLKDISLDLEEIYTRLYEISGISYEYKIPTVSHDMAAINEQRRVLESKKDELEAKYNLYHMHVLFIENIFQKADEEDRNILKRHYVDGVTWFELADELHYSERNLRYKVDRFLVKIADTTFKNEL